MLILLIRLELNNIHSQSYLQRLINFQMQCQNNISVYKSHLIEQGWESIPPLFQSSAKTGEGKKEILNYIESINSNL